MCPERSPVRLLDRVKQSRFSAETRGEPGSSRLAQFRRLAVDHHDNIGALLREGRVECCLSHAPRELGRKESVRVSRHGEVAPDVLSHRRAQDENDCHHGPGAGGRHADETADQRALGARWRGFVGVRHRRIRERAPGRCRTRSPEKRARPGSPTAAIPRVASPSSRSRARRANDAAIAAAGGIPNTAAASR